MKIIGVTGGIGAGKSTVCALFAGCGGVVIDADKISREVMEQGRPAYRETVAFFGKDILLPTGEINRKALAALVFHDAEQLEVLNKITHKYIFAEMQKRIEQLSEDAVAVLDVPLLFASDFPFVCDKTVAVLAEREMRIHRVQSRDGADRQSVLNRIERQLTDEEYRSRADVCIENSGDAEELCRQVQKIYDGIRNEMRA